MPKTRLAFRDQDDGQAPFGLQGVCEFDVYQEALDYAVASARYLSAATSTVYIYLYSYDNPSYLIKRVGDAVTTTSIEFPFVG